MYRCHCATALKKEMESEGEIITAELGLGVALRECQRPSLLLPQPWPPMLGVGQEILGAGKLPHHRSLKL